MSSVPPQLALSGLAGITAILVSQKWSVTSFQNSGSSKGKAPFSWTATGKWGLHNNVYTSNRGSKERREQTSLDFKETHKERHAFLVLPWFSRSQVLAHYLRSLWVAWHRIPAPFIFLFPFCPVWRMDPYPPPTRIFLLLTFVEIMPTQGSTLPWVIPFGLG